MILKKKKSRIIAIALISLLVLSGVYIYKSINVDATNNVKETKTVTVLKKDIKIAISADGKASYPIFNVNFKTNGIVEDIYIKEGQKINAGEKLAKLDTKNLEYQVQQATANYNSSLAKYNKVKSGPSSVEVYAKQIAVNNAKNALIISQESYDYKLQQFNEAKLSEIEIITEKSKLESAKAQISSTEAQLKITNYTDSNDLTVAKEAVNQTKAALDIAKNNISESIITSPSSGVILSINGKAGEAVSSSGTSQTQGGVEGFITLANTNNVTVEASILEDDINRIKLNQPVEVIFNALQDDMFTGKVTLISLNPVIDQSGIVTYKVFITIEKGNENIKLGMTAGLSFIIEQVKNVVTAPNVAIKRIDGSASVEILKSDGTSNWQKIETGLTDGTNVEIKTGLKEGDKILIRKVVKK